MKSYPKRVHDAFVYCRFRILIKTASSLRSPPCQARKPGLNGPLRGDNYPDTGGRQTHAKKPQGDHHAPHLFQTINAFILKSGGFQAMRYTHTLLDAKGVPMTCETIGM